MGAGRGALLTTCLHEPNVHVRPHPDLRTAARDRRGLSALGSLLLTRLHTDSIRGPPQCHRTRTAHARRRCGFPRHRSRSSLCSRLRRCRSTTLSSYRRQPCPSRMNRQGRPSTAPTCNSKFRGTRPNASMNNRKRSRRLLPFPNAREGRRQSRPRAICRVSRHHLISRTMTTTTQLKTTRRHPLRRLRRRRPVAQAEVDPRSVKFRTHSSSAAVARRSTTASRPSAKPSRVCAKKASASLRGQKSADASEVAGTKLESGVVYTSSRYCRQVPVARLSRSSSSCLLCLPCLGRLIPINAVHRGPSRTLRISGHRSLASRGQRCQQYQTFPRCRLQATPPPPPKSIP